jgi:hypothetical protein
MVLTSDGTVEDMFTTLTGLTKKKNLHHRLGPKIRPLHGRELELRRIFTHQSKYIQSICADFFLEDIVLMRVVGSPILVCFRYYNNINQKTWKSRTL